MVDLNKGLAITIDLGQSVLASDSTTIVNSLDVNSVSGTIFQNGVVTSLSITSAGGGDGALTHARDGFWNINVTSAQVNSLGSGIISIADNDTALAMWASIDVVASSYWWSKQGTIPNAAEIADLPNSAAIFAYVPSSANVAALPVSGTVAVVGSLQTVPLSAVQSEAATAVLSNANALLALEATLDTKANSGTASIVGSLQTTPLAAINSEAYLATMTYVGSLAQAEATAVPGATPNIAEALMWQQTLSRNKITQNASVQAIHNDAGTVIASASVTDASSTFTRNEFAST